LPLNVSLIVTLLDHSKNNTHRLRDIKTGIKNVRKTSKKREKIRVLNKSFDLVAVAVTYTDGTHDEIQPNRG
jgi:hypothetical protein